MNILDRDLINAEVDANIDREDQLSYIATHGPDIERQWTSNDDDSTTDQDLAVRLHGGIFDTI